MEKNNSHWGEKETKFLLCMWRQDEILRQTSKGRAGKVKRGEKVHREMSASMTEAGYTRTPTQIKNKIRAMTKTYNEVNKHNGRSGRYRITSPVCLHPTFRARCSSNQMVEQHAGNGLSESFAHAHYLLKNRDVLKAS